MQNNPFFLRHPSVCPSVGTGKFHYHLSTHSSFGQNRTAIAGTLHEDPMSFFAPKWQDGSSAHVESPAASRWNPTWRCNHPNRRQATLQLKAHRLQVAMTSLTIMSNSDETAIIVTLYVTLMTYYSLLPLNGYHNVEPILKGHAFQNIYLFWYLFESIIYYTYLMCYTSEQFTYCFPEYRVWSYRLVH